MNACVATEQRFLKHRNKYYAQAVGGYAFWKRYLDVFSSVQIAARVEETATLPAPAVRADGPGVKILPLPTYDNPIAALLKSPLLLHKTRIIAKQADSFILRVPGAIGTLMFIWLKARRWPFAVEVVGDPYDSLSKDALQKEWSFLMRPLAVAALKAQCRNATGASYVTEKTLQNRYPAGGEFSTHYSSVELSKELIDFARSRKLTATRVLDRERCPRLIFVGSLSQRYKGLHILLEALQILVNEGIEMMLVVLGDGQYRQEYERQAYHLGLDSLVEFVGYVPQGLPVFERLCKADLFVMPSLMEGLPRAMLEAMLCGLPCIGSEIGGIPELLQDEDLVAPGDARILADRIRTMLNNPGRMRETGRRNYETAMRFRADLLREKRRVFYDRLRRVTEKHLTSGV